jgi:glyoxylase-like metal-dependent hydrolase (beta-lactamase superfamily II)
MSESETNPQVQPSPSIDLGGGITVTALTDAVADHRRPIEECFPGEPAHGWPTLKERYPETVSADGRWRLPITTFLLRTPALSLLVDAGVGCERTIASEVFQVVGSLPTRLARVGVTPDDLQHVVFTHLHEDHLGWADDPDTGDPTFPNAVYRVHEAEWAANHRDDLAPDWVAQALDPVERHGHLVLSELGALTDELELVSLPGHTPGHVGLVITGPDARVTLVGDAFNHPYQVTDPALPSIADFDRAQATATRRGISAKAASGEWPLLGSAHFPGAWWTVVTEDERLRWRPHAPLNDH